MLKILNRFVIQHVFHKWCAEFRNHWKAKRTELVPSRLSVVLGKDELRDIATAPVSIELNANKHLVAAKTYIISCDL